MNIVCYPARDGDLEALHQILRGGADKVAEAGAVILGGHSVEDREPKYGLAVTGIVAPDKVITNRGPDPGMYSSSPNPSAPESSLPPPRPSWPRTKLSRPPSTP
jgi:hypothetical protein